MNPSEMDHGHQEEDYGHHQWTDIGGYQSSQHPSPLHEYNAYGGFIPTPPNPLSMGSMYDRTIPPPYVPPQLVMPISQWPSMMNPTATYPPPILPATPVSAPISTPASASTTTTNHSLPTPTPRRTLTDMDRRRMCQYHEDNPTVKQTEIGGKLNPKEFTAMFGVERSTVSKVLRQKEKYLFPDDGSRSPIKGRSKGKSPDIERALSNWARNQQKQGLPVTDHAIREKARFFASNVSNSETHLKITSSAWLEKFKQKNNLSAKSRKGSVVSVIVDEDSDRKSNSNPASATQTPNGISPVSPAPAISPSPRSPPPTIQEGCFIKHESPSSMIDFSNPYGHSHSQSSASVTSAFSDAPTLPNQGPTSPTSPFFSPDPSVSASPFTTNARLPPLSSNSIRPRSQTFPIIGGVEQPMPQMLSPPTSSDTMSSNKLLQTSLSTPVLESPLEDEAAASQMSTLLSISPHQTLKRNHSSPNVSTNTVPTKNMRPPPPPPSAPPTLSQSSTTPTRSSTTTPTLGLGIGLQQPHTPTQDEARRALETIMAFFQQHQSKMMVEPQEFVTIGKLMQKLELVSPSSTGGSNLPGGLHRIDEQVVGGEEMGMTGIEEMEGIMDAMNGEERRGRKKRSICSV
ncbi:MAG: hypothetical protein M1834_008395 [Cirrosporium novae-zelandiae]|nr:MAG: hypothetical protein M1834_008395 [Cirrosporium novae-zelandiae]